MSDGMLVAVTQRMLIGAFRDVAKLTDYSFTQAKLEAMDAAKIAFARLPNDLELSAMLGEKTQEKKAKRKETTEYVMIEIMQRVQLKYTVDSKVYRHFGVRDIYNEWDADFFILLHRVHRLATNLFASLEEYGLTTAHLEALATLADEYLAAWKVQDQAIDDRETGVESRITAGNDLYNDVSRLSELGKRLWWDKSESHYNDYVMYPNKTAAKEKQMGDGDVPENKVLNITATAMTADSAIAGTNEGSVPSE